MKLGYNQSNDTGLGIFSVLERADQEIEILKKSRISTKSRYWKPIKKQDNEASKVGVKQTIFTEGNLRGVYDEWNKGYAYFCDQKVNTKGQKVNRERLKEYGMMKQPSFGNSEKKRKN